MQHDEFIGQVQARARLASRGDAEAATRATLETLGERLPEGLAGNLAAQLPQEIGEHLRRTADVGKQGREGQVQGESFGRPEFVARVSQRERADPPAAAYHARVVLEVVGEATTGGIMTRVRESLPEDLRDFVTAGSQGQLD